MPELPAAARSKHPRAGRTVAALAATGLLLGATPSTALSPPVRDHAPTAAATGTATPGHVDPGFSAAVEQLLASRPTPRRAATAEPRRSTSSARDPFADFIGNNYFDECGDASGFDIKKFAIIDNEVDDLTYLWGTCQDSPSPKGPDDAIVFYIDDTTQDQPQGQPSLVLIQSTFDATWELYETFRSPNVNQWQLSQSGVGDITAIDGSDGGPREVGAIQIDALAADYPLRYFVSVATVVQDQQRDVIPESDMPPIRFPDGCDYFELHGATIRGGGPASLAAGAAAAAAAGARGIARPDGSVLAWPVDRGLLAALDAIPGVEATRPVVYRAMADPEPNQWALDQVRLERAWTAVPSAPATIAVLDQGVDGQRPDLLGRVGAGYDAVAGTTFAAGVDSALGPHGTAVSGVAVAIRDNGIAVAGVNDGATILPVRVFDHSSCADDGSIAAGIDWAIGRGADIINLSLGGPGESRTLELAIDRAVAAGVLVIAATGNDQEFAPDRESYPAAYPDVIGIGATGPDGLASYSQHAATEFVVPGGAFSGRRESDLAVLEEWDRIEYQAGTSYAAPFAAALVSLWLADHPGATLAEVRAALRDAAVDLPGDGDGFGLIDAVELLGEAVPVPAAPAIDGNPRTTHRLPQDQAIEAGLSVSRLRFPDPGTAPVAVLARDDTFADALSGAPLTRDGPLLFTRTADADVRVLDELDRVLLPDGTIYVLGGPNAVSDEVVSRVRQRRPDARVVRLFGPNRFETSRQIVVETVARYGQPNQVLLARGFGPASDPNGTAAWADAIAGASFAASRRWPLLVVRTEGLEAADVELLDAILPANGLVNLLGGPAALSPTVADQAAAIRTTRRIAGTNRDRTAARIADTLWGIDAAGPQNLVLLNVHQTTGWYLGLAAAGYQAEIEAPTLAVRTDQVPPETAALLARCGTAQVELWVAGGLLSIPKSVVADADALDGQPC